MDFETYLNKFNAQRKINKLAKLYRNKKVVIWGMGEFSKILFKNYDFSRLNIIAVTDSSFELKKCEKFFCYNCISPQELGSFNCDVILIAEYDYKQILTLLDDHLLYQTQNENIEIRPVIKLSLYDIFFKGGYDY